MVPLQLCSAQLEGVKNIVGLISHSIDLHVYLTLFLLFCQTRCMAKVFKSTAPFGQFLTTKVKLFRLLYLKRLQGPCNPTPDTMWCYRAIRKKTDKYSNKTL